MTELAVARLNTAVLVVVGGMVAGHVLMPFRADASLVTRVGFLASIVAIGAARGWRDAGLRDRSPRAIRIAAAVGALAALGLAMLAYVVVHGRPP